MFIKQTLKTWIFAASFCAIAWIAGVPLTLVAQSAPANDPPEAQAFLAKARELAAGNKNLSVAETLQCREPGFIVPIGPAKYMHHALVPTKIFDNFYLLGEESVDSFLITTPKGLILIDAGFTYTPEEMILPQMKQLGLDPNDIKYVLISHGHGDHALGVKYFQDKYHARVVTSAGEWDLMEHEKWQLGMPEDMRGEYPKRDLIATDGEKFTFGGQTITFVLTPGHSPATLSMIIPVTDHGNPHVIAFWGGTAPQSDPALAKAYPESAKKFVEYTDAAHADVALSNHPFVDNSLEKMTEVRNRNTGAPNPFVVGEDETRRFIEVLGDCAAMSYARLQGGIVDKTSVGVAGKKAWDAK